MVAIRHRRWPGDTVRLAVTITVILALIGCSAGVNDDRAGTETPYPIRTVPAGGGATPSPAGITISAVTRDRAGEAALSTAIAADPANAALLRQRAAVRVALADLGGAIADLDAASVLDPPNARALLARGEVLLRRGLWERALADLDAAIRQDPSLGDAYLARARTRSALARGDVAVYRAALDDLTLARATANTPAAIPVVRARVLLDRHTYRGDPADLAAVVDGFRANPPAVPAGIAVAAEALARSGDLAGAGSVLETAPPATSPEDRASLDLAAAMVAALGGDDDRAAEQVSAALVADPWSWPARRFQIEASLDAGRAEEARDRAKEVLVLLPDDPETVFLLGRALVATGEIEAAREQFDLTAELAPDSPVYRARIAEALESLSPGSGPVASPPDPADG